MKKILAVFLLILIIVSLVSCKGPEYVCYYGYFTDSAFILVYSREKNTLYKIDIPLEMIVQWGIKQGIESVPEVMRNFSGLKESGFMLGTPQTLQACRDIFDAMSGYPNPDTSSRLTVIAKRAKELGHEPLITNISRLCGCDMSGLTKVMQGRDSSVAVMDSKVIFDKGDIEYSRVYFKTWIEQMIK